MTRKSKVLSTLLLTGSLLLGGAAPWKQGVKNESTSSGNALTNVSGAPSQSAPVTPLPGDNHPVVSASAVTYTIDWSSINGGGTVNATSTNYQMGASIGQSVAGAATSTSYQMGIGFWYGAAGGCSCPCKYDPQCDGVVSDILDVTLTINRAFRGAAIVQDPGCPVERTDVNASTATDVIDVTKVINVAFRGMSVASQYLDPCAP